jgi:hypothetical protein
MGALPALIAHKPALDHAGRAPLQPRGGRSRRSRQDGFDDAGRTVEVLFALTHATLAIRREPHYKCGPIGGEAC